MAKTRGKRIPAKARERIGELYRALLHHQVQGSIRVQLLTPAQQRRASSMEGMKVVKMWARSQKITETRAVIEIARLIGRISEAEAIGLRRQIGDQAGLGLQSDKPHWDRDRGELRLGDQLARRIARPGVARNIVPILDAFQEQRWRARIENPLPDGFDSQRLREAIASLNTGLKLMRFHADGSGQGVVWVYL